MDVLLLGAAAIVLLLLTIWIVWRPGASENPSAPQQEEDPGMIPQGDAFEDQYTSATADLSAGGVALAEAAAADAETETETTSEPSTPVETSFGEAGGPWPQDTPRSTGSAAGFMEPVRRTAADDVPSSRLTAKPVVLGVAALGTLGALAAAWGFARWQRERNKPLNRLRRRLR